MQSTLLFVLVVVAAVSAAVIDNNHDVANADVVNSDVTNLDMANSDANPDGDSPQTRDNRSNGIILGTVGEGTLVNSFVVTSSAAATAVARDVRLDVPTGLRVSGLRVTELGVSQGATVVRWGGGVENTFVTMRLTNAANRGYHFFFEFWAV